MHVRDAGGVVGVSPSTLLSVAHTPRTEVDSALDMGTGSGAHALLAARHAQRVVATDTNPRALRMLRLNAALNAIDNVQTRAGSWFEPVAGERFDLVIANPPYVISPDTSFLYRDGGLRGDALSSTLLRELPAVLKPGGFASLQGNWTHDRDTPWWRTPAACLVAGDCDAFVVRLGTVDALEYALRWVEPHHRDDPGGYEPAVARWRDRYREDRIELISTATVVLRRRTAANWRYAVTRSDWPPYAMGRRWPRLFEAQDRLRCLDGGALLGARMRPVIGLGVQFAVGGDPSCGCLLRAATAVTQRRAVSRATAELVLALEDGGRPGDVAGVARLHPDELRALVKLGFLELLQEAPAGPRLTA
jgi:SAM-dependent methyltransferase